MLYLLTCNYVRSNILVKQRINFHLDEINIKPVKRKHCFSRGNTQKYFYSRFLQENHNDLFTDCDIVITDKTDPAEPTVREMY